MNRARASVLTRRVQVLALLFAGGAVAAGVIPMTSKGAPVVDEPAPVVVVKPVEAPVEVSPTDLATAIDAVAPPVKIVEKPPEVIVPVAPPPAAWKYLGGIISGSYKRAVVTIDERQHLLSEGGKVESTELIEIDPAFIRIKDAAGAEQRIELAARQKTQLHIASGTRGAPTTYGAGNAPGVRTANGRRGLPPEEAERRAKLMEQLKELSPEDRREKLQGLGIDESELEGKEGGGKGGGGKGGK